MTAKRSRSAAGLFAQAQALHRAGRLAEAVAAWRRLVARFPNHAEAHFQLGCLYRALGDGARAAASFRRTVALKPDAVAAHYNLGNLWMEQGRLDQAHQCYRQAIAARPNFPEALNNLGNILRDWGRTEEAGGCYARALAGRPDFPEALSNLGSVLKDLGHLADAERCLRRAVELKPDYPAAHNNLGNLLKARGRAGEAITHYARAITLKPDFTEAVSNLGAALRSVGKYDEAMTCFDFAMALNPDYPDIHNNLGNLLQARGRLDAAAAEYDRAVELRPRFPEPLNNRATLFQAAGEVGRAIGYYRRAIDIRANYAEAHNNLAMALLSQGRMEEGWREYEWRWLIPDMVNARRDFRQPQWRGEAGEDRTLLVHAEQGFGDTLQFCRLVAGAAARGLRVVVEVQRPLVRLLQGLPGAVAVVGRGDALPQFDLHCPMLSLPAALGTTLATIPAAPAYLAADPAAVAAWRRRLDGDRSGGLRVGLVWAGNPRRHSPELAEIDRRRSMAPEHLAPLAGIPGLRLFSLQKDGPPAPAELDLVDVMGEMEDFADTAALVATLDLVLAVDTAMAHLAAALGKPVWLLDRFDSCWRWLGPREDSPWYPTLRRFRQPSPGDWAGVVGAVCDELRHGCTRSASAAVRQPPRDRPGASPPGFHS